MNIEICLNCKNCYFSSHRYLRDTEEGSGVCELALWENHSRFTPWWIICDSEEVINPDFVIPKDCLYILEQTL